MKHYIIYQIKNKLNGMFYVGKHKTDCLDDGYMGSGIRIQRAINKYGLENFEKTILFECSSEQEMNEMESKIVDIDFISRDDVYNIALGGYGSFDYINKSGLNKYPGWTPINKRNGDIFEKTGIYPSSVWQKKMKIENPERYELICQKISNSVKKHIQTYGSVWSGKKHSEQSKQKIRETHKKNKTQVGIKNSQYGTVCLFNDCLRKNIRVKRDEIQAYLNDGWKLGSVYNWEKYFDKTIKKQKNKKVGVKTKECVQNKDDLLKNKKQLYSEMYDFYCENGWNETVNKFNYKYSHPNFIQQCKKYVESYIPQNGKKRGNKF